MTSAALLKEAKAFHLKKRLGQHFLVDADVLQTIVASLGATTGDTVIEVGPGIGFLTRFLAETGANIIAVDLDRESTARLQQMQMKNVHVKHGDFLRFDLNAEDFFKKGETLSAAPAEGGRKIKVVGNVPYQITGLILGHLLGEINRQSPWLHRIEDIVLTVQREVALRMVAEPGSDAYSRVSLLIDYYCQSELVQIIPPQAFYPPPEVTSAIVKLVPRPAVQANNPTLLKQLIDAGFRQRRKMLRNSLSFLRLPQNEVDRLFKRLSFDPQVRAERLSIQQFAMLADAVDEHLKSNADDSSAGAG
jgi:16S rRNA (adenine1518-N6/adenine1519-N6)-dimethyltransferase